MTPDTAAVSVPVADETEVMASVDGDEGSERLVIADISCEDAWISMPIGDTVSIPDWR